MNYKEWLAQAMADLAQKNPTENSKIDALVLLQHVTGKSRTQILTFDDTEIDEKVRLKLTALLDIRYPNIIYSWIFNILKRKLESRLNPPYREKR